MSNSFWGVNGQSYSTFAAVLAASPSLVLYGPPGTFTFFENGSPVVGPTLEINDSAAYFLKDVNGALIDYGLGFASVTVAWNAALGDPNVLAQFPELTPAAPGPIALAGQTKSGGVWTQRGNTAIILTWTSALTPTEWQIRRTIENGSDTQIVARVGGGQTEYEEYLPTGTGRVEYTVATPDGAVVSNTVSVTI